MNGTNRAETRFPSPSSPEAKDLPMFLKTTTGLAASLMLMAAPLTAMAQDQAAPVEARTEEQQQSRTPSAEQVLSSLETVSPLDLVYVVVKYWKRGDRQQAAFWYYIWQIRTDAWADLDSGFGLYRSMLDNDVSITINNWIGSDPEMWRDTVERAIAYEPKLPMWRLRPEGMTLEEWSAHVDAKRAEYARETADMMARMSPEQMIAARREAGLPVGPLVDAGTPLPDEWR